METIQRVKEWAIERNLHTADPKKQLYKLLEECGELSGGIAKGKPEMVLDAVGDMIVVQTILLMQLDEDIAEIIKDGDIEEKHYLDDYEALSGITKAIAHLFAEVDQVMGVRNFRGKDKIRDILVALDEIAANYHASFNECLCIAYDEIKDRKGRMVDGVFVKEADLKVYPQ